MPEYRLMDDIIYPYMRETRNEKKTSTQKTEACVAKPLESFFRRMFISEITGAVVRQYRRSRIDVDGVVPATVLRELALASKAVNYAISEWDWDMHNPFEKRMISDKDRKAMKPRGVRLITKDEEGVLLAECRRRGGEFWESMADVISFAVNTGLRMSEILDLKWWQVSGDVITMTPETQKSNRHAQCIMNETAIEIVAGRPQRGERVFEVGGMAIHRRKVQDAVEALRDATAVDFVFSDTRKTCGQRILNAGRDIVDVQYQLRHSDIRTTQKSYLTAPLDRLRLAVGDINS